MDVRVGLAEQDRRRLPIDLPLDIAMRLGVAVRRVAAIEPTAALAAVTNHRCRGVGCSCPHVQESSTQHRVLHAGDERERVDLDIRAAVGVAATARAVGVGTALGPQQALAGLDPDRLGPVELWHGQLVSGVDANLGGALHVCVGAGIAVGAERVAVGLAEALCIDTGVGVERDRPRQQHGRALDRDRRH